MALVGVERVLLAEAEAALEGAALVVLVPDLDRLVHQTAELRGHSGGARVEQLHAGVDGPSHGGGRGGFLGDGQAGQAVGGTEGIVILPVLDGDLINGSVRIRMTRIVRSFSSNTHKSSHLARVDTLGGVGVERGEEGVVGEGIEFGRSASAKHSHFDSATVGPFPEQMNGLVVIVDKGSPHIVVISDNGTVRLNINIGTESEAGQEQSPEGYNPE